MMPWKLRNYSRFQLLALLPALVLLGHRFAVADKKVGDVGVEGTVVGARGGTELMDAMLTSRLPKFLSQDRFHIIKSRVREVSRSKTNVLWLHDLPSDTESQHLRDPASRQRFAKIIFVSEWQRQQYIQHFGVSFDQGVVLRNAIVPLPVKAKSRGQIRLIYHTTPHRGLEILIPTFIQLYEKYGDAISLDVYSSFSIYGWSERDEPYAILFETCRNHPGCTYHGAVSNEQVREALLDSHIFAYPSIWQETSCIAAIEALSAGCEVVTSNLGALPETLNGFGTVYTYTADKHQHQQIFAQQLDRAISSFWDPELVQRRRMQQIYASRTFDWGFLGFRGRIDEWVQVLASVESDLDASWTLPTRSSFETQTKFVQGLFVAGRMAEVKGNIQKSLQLYGMALELEPQNTHVLVALGHLSLMSGDSSQSRNSGLSEQGSKLLEFALSSDAVTPQLDLHSDVFYEMAVRIAYFRSSRYRDDLSFYWFDRALESMFPRDDCWELTRAGSVPHIPRSAAEEKQNLARFHKFMASMMERDDLMCSNANAYPSAFPLAYYDINYKEELSIWVNLLAKAFPWLNHQSPLLLYENEAKAVPRPSSATIRIGVVSSFFSVQSSIWGNFGWMIQHLQAHPKLDVSLIYYPREPVKPEDQKLSLSPETNIYLEKIGFPDSLARNRNFIEQRQFDILLYLDLFMTNEMHQLALSKLAPVQVCTHGHPVTSAIPRIIMDYYLSWEAAELPNKTIAQGFYTEELYLIADTNRPWEYYEPRTTPEKTSLIAAGSSFRHYTRDNIDFLRDSSDAELLRSPKANWYFCAQASFKFDRVFDRILGAIQKSDPNAVIILIELKDVLTALNPKSQKRLVTEGNVDLQRVLFIPRMLHHQLMAMYSLADCVLDSVYFGGDTTTREAFETGAPVITLPHKTIGQRWTQAYYRMMGIHEFIAKDPDDYVRIAVEVATLDENKKKALRKRIKDAAYEKLYRNHDAQNMWADALIDMANKPRHWHWKGQRGTTGVETEL